MPGRIIGNDHTRAWLYRIVTALAALLVTLGLLTEDVAGDVLVLAGAILAVGEGTLAAANTPTKGDG